MKEEATTPASYRYPTKTKTLGDFKLHVRGGEFTKSQIIVIQGLKKTGKTTFLRMLAGNLRPDAVEFKMPKYNVSHKPQCIGFMMSRSTVKDMLLKKIPDAYVDPHFRSLVFQPLLIQQLMDLDNVDLSDAQLQRLELCLCLGKSADIYLIDEPSTYLDSEERSAAAKVIKNYILYAKKTAFVVETNPSVGLAIYDKVIIFDGEPASDIIATPPANHFINLLVLELLVKDKTLGGEILPARYRV